MKVTIEVDENVDGIEAVDGLVNYRKLMSDLDVVYNLARSELKYGECTVETLIKTLESIKEASFRF